MLDFASTRRTFRVIGGWYPILTSTIASDRLEFSYHSDSTIDPDAADLQIIRRALSLLSDSTAWSRTDDGEVPLVKCAQPPVRRSLFCALHDASVEVDGEFFWGRPVAMLVRSAVQRHSHKAYQHWLTGYNRDPGTTFADIRAVFESTATRIAARLSTK